MMPYSPAIIGRGGSLKSISKILSKLKCDQAGNVSEDDAKCIQ
jgi:hypothetical protein